MIDTNNGDIDVGGGIGGKVGCFKEELILTGSVELLDCGWLALTEPVPFKLFWLLLLLLLLFVAIVAVFFYLCQCHVVSWRC